MKFSSIAIWLTVTLTSCGATYRTVTTPEPAYFKVEVIQNGKAVKEENDVVTLEKAPFKYRLTLFRTDNVFVSNSWGVHYYDYPMGDNIFKCDEDSAEGINDKCRFVSVKTGNEDKFNTNKDIYVGDRTYHGVWFYDEGMDWHRMDKGVVTDNGVITAEVTVENIYDLDRRDEGSYEQSEFNYPINKIDKDIYVVFATDRYERGMSEPEELQREKFILRFR